MQARENSTIKKLEEEERKLQQARKQLEKGVDFFDEAIKKTVTDYQEKKKKLKNRDTEESEILACNTTENTLYKILNDLDLLGTENSDLISQIESIKQQQKKVELLIEETKNTISFKEFCIQRHRHKLNKKEMQELEQEYDTLQYSLKTLSFMKINLQKEDDQLGSAQKQHRISHASSLRDKIKDMNYDQIMELPSKMENCKNIIQAAHQERDSNIERHRGWGGLMTNLLLCVTGIGAVLGVISIMHRVFTGKYLVGETNTSSNLGKLTQSIKYFNSTGFFHDAKKVKEPPATEQEAPQAYPVIC